MNLAVSWRTSFITKARTIAKRSKAPGAKAKRVLRFSAAHGTTNAQMYQAARGGRQMRRGHRREGSEFRSKRCAAEQSWFERDAVVPPSYTSAEDLHELLETPMSGSMSSPLIAAWK